MGFPKIGDFAPEFSLRNHQDKDVSLNFFREKKIVVIYFYPKAMTPGCTIQAKGLRDIADILKHKKVVVLGISPDPSKKLAKFIERDELNFDLLSDEDNKVASDYGAWGQKKFMGREYIGILRTTFIIGADGRLKAVLDKFKTKEHHQVLLEKLTELGL